MTIRFRSVLAASALATLSGAALAHPGHAPASFASGFAHPLGGLDHLLAMLAVGLYAARQAGRCTPAAAHRLRAGDARRRRPRRARPRPARGRGRHFRLGAGAGPAGRVRRPPAAGGEPAPGRRLRALPRPRPPRRDGRRHAARLQPRLRTRDRGPARGRPGARARLPRQPRRTPRAAPRRRRESPAWASPCSAAEASAARPPGRC
jgi:hypothetical protein